jgi:hypothetical protein
MPEIESYSDPALEKVLSELLRGDALITPSKSVWLLELDGSKVKSDIVRRLFRGGKGRMHLYQGRYVLNLKGIMYALDRLPKQKLGKRLPSEIGLHTHQRYAFRIILALKLRIGKQNGKAIDGAFVIKSAEKTLDYVRKFYKIEKPVKEEKLVIAEDEPQNRMFANQFRRKEFLRPKIRVQHKH